MINFFGMDCYLFFDLLAVLQPRLKPDCFADAEWTGLQMPAFFVFGLYFLLNSPSEEGKLSVIKGVDGIIGVAVGTGHIFAFVMIIFGCEFKEGCN